jgi:hypothetical protein
LATARDDHYTASAVDDKQEARSRRRICSPRCAMRVTTLRMTRIPEGSGNRGRLLVIGMIVVAVLLGLIALRFRRTPPARPTPATTVTAFTAEGRG